MNKVYCLTDSVCTVTIVAISYEQAKAHALSNNLLCGDLPIHSREITSPSAWFWARCKPGSPKYRTKIRTGFWMEPRLILEAAAETAGPRLLSCSF